MTGLVVGSPVQPASASSATTTATMTAATVEGPRDLAATAYPRWLGLLMVAVRGCRGQLTLALLGWAEGKGRLFDDDISRSRQGEPEA